MTAKALRLAVLGDSTAVGQGAGYRDGIAVGAAEHLAQARSGRAAQRRKSGAVWDDVRGEQVARVARFAPDVALIAAGANDVTHLTSTGAVTKDAEATVARLRAANAEVEIVLTGAPAMGVVPRFAQPLRWVAGQRTRRLNAGDRRDRRRTSASRLPRSRSAPDSCSPRTAACSRRTTSTPARAATRPGARSSLGRSTRFAEARVDHCGGNHLFAGRPIYVQRRELDDARSEDDYTIREWVEAPGVRYVPVDGELELLAGLRLVPAPGHTRGMQVVVVETGGRPVVVGGDVAVWFGELDEPHTEGQLRVRALDPELVWLAHEHEPWRPRTV
jgi:lysophospholipase L1-like esterase